MKRKPEQPTAAGPSEGSRRTPDSYARGGTRWTPGPWLLNDKRAEVSVQCGEVIANCWQFSQIDDPDECLANAQLIAAAPDLYAALEALAIATASADSPADQGVSSYGPEMDAARAALAKARGER